MFKLESYITPIILSYVERYVQNIRVDDAQESLVDGEVLLQNLDLKLDVLEEELSLPFQLISGHIKELAIRVPWTKLASEPIAVTINTIDCVMKLQEQNDCSSLWRDSTSKNSWAKEALPSGCTAALINRIVGNIAIYCYDVTLNYVEEAIEASIKIEQLSMESADNNWKPAFNDSTSRQVLQRKLINIVGMTISVDEPNPAGDVEIHQEPVLHRSTLQARLLMKSPDDGPTVTRIDFHSELLDVHVSPQQIPMLLRLFELGMVLNDGMFAISQDQNLRVDAAKGQQKASRVWTLLQPFDSKVVTSDKLDDRDFDVFHVGCYVDRLRMILKIQQPVRESTVVTAEYTPFLTLHLGGIHGELITSGLKWRNISAGIAEIRLQSTGDCPCGQPMQIRDILEFKDNRLRDDHHIAGSLFDGTSAEGKKYHIDWNIHFRIHTQDVLLQRSPGVAIDFAREEKVSNDRSTPEHESDGEINELSPRYELRAFFGQFCMKLGADSQHRINTLISYKNCLKYLPYNKERLYSTVSSPTDDDAQINGIVRKKIDIVIPNTSVEIHPFTHVNATKNSFNPFIKLKIRDFTCNILIPLYAHRRTFKTCKLSEPPVNMFHEFSSNVNSVEARVQRDYDESIIGRVCDFNIQHKYLTSPELWPRVDFIKNEFSFGLSAVSFGLNRRQGECLHFIGSSFIYPNVTCDPLRECVSESEILCNETRLKNILFHAIVSERTMCLMIDGCCCSFINEDLQGTSPHSPRFMIDGNNCRKFGIYRTQNQEWVEGTVSEEGPEPHGQEETFFMEYLKKIKPMVNYAHIPEISGGMTWPNIPPDYVNFIKNFAVKKS